MEVVGEESLRRILQGNGVVAFPGEEYTDFEVYATDQYQDPKSMFHPVPSPMQNHCKTSVPLHAGRATVWWLFPGRSTRILKCTPQTGYPPFTSSAPAQARLPGRI